MDVGRLRNTKVSVIGAARSGVPVAQLLKREGTTVFVSDSGDPARLAASIAELRSSGIEYEIGAHTERVYGCSLMVISPGVPNTAPVVVEAGKRGIEVVSEIEVASWFCSSPIVAITGSNGKTTTATLLGRIFDDAKKKHVVAGNIGTAFSHVVLDVAEAGIVVLEVSSFQLDFIRSFRPRISVLLNITRNHMDRYSNSMEKYAASKARVFMNQTPDDFLIYNADDEWTVRQVEQLAQSSGATIPFSIRSRVERGGYVENGQVKTRLFDQESDIVATADVSIKGEHNLYNAMAATLAAQLTGVSPAYIRATLKNFRGVEHRLEFVREVGGVKFFNDSKATTVDAVWYALQTFAEPIVLILGGKDKGNDYTKLFEPVRRKVRAVIAIGVSADTIVRNFSDKVPVSRIETVGDKKPNVESMKKALDAAAAVAQDGDVVLLSPACTSFDWFENFEERGRVFKSLVSELAAVSRI